VRVDVNCFPYAPFFHAAHSLHAKYDRR
jgi:hypothetical protein